MMKLFGVVADNFVLLKSRRQLAGFVGKRKEKVVRDSGRKVLER
jgi:hypothetical protein